MTLRVAIAYNFNDRDWFGGRNYFASLLTAVRECAIPGEFEFVLVTGRKTETTLPGEFPELRVLRTRLMDRRSLGWWCRQFDLRMLNADRLLARYLLANGIDILSHSMHLGPRPGIKTVSWLYDFQFLHLPRYWNPKHVRWARQWYGAASRFCDAVIVSSRDALADLASFAPDGTATRHVLPFVSNPVDLGRLPRFEELRQRYALPDRYFYLPNQFWTNKNHRLVIDALALLRQERESVTVVCTGKPEDGRQPGYFDELMAHCRSVGVNESFRVLGIVPFRDTQALMANARAVINPSRFEGWSTTVEEAKTLQRELFLSDIAVHREQSPEHGSFFPADDPGALARLLRQAQREPARPLCIDAMQAEYSVRLRTFGTRYLDILRSLTAPLPRPLDA